MNELSGRQRALLDFLAAYHPDGFGPAERNELPEVVLADLDALIECGDVQVRFVPQPRLPADVEARIERMVPVARDVVDAAPREARPAPPQAKAKAPPAAKRGGSKSGWDAERKATFFEILAATGNARKAEAAVGAGTGSAYYHRTNDAAFREVWDEALAKFRGERPAKAPPAEVKAASPARLSEFAAKATPPPKPTGRRSDAAIAAAALAHQAEQQRIRELRPAMSVDEAKLILQRKGRIVHRASVTGGPKDRWVVSGFAEPIDDAMLKAEAERVEGLSAK